MNANEFVKKFGWDGIQGVITNADSITTHVKVYEHDTILIDYIHWDGLRISIKENGEWVRLSRKYQNVPDFICINDLKRLVESHELVEKYKNRHGGIRFRIRWGMFRYGDTQEFNDRLKQALNLVEQCQ